MLCTEGLTHLTNRADHVGLINGIQFLEQGPSIHHLLFADDNLFLCKAQADQASTIQLILTTYGELTGQTINLDKSSLSFGNKVDEQLRVNIQGKFGIFSEGGVGSYLGLPECFSGSKVDFLAFIQEKMKARFSGWYAKSLLHGGKEMLLKAVAMALPVYAMSCFKLPKSTCKKLTSAMADYWWNTMENKKKIHWIDRDKLCILKQDGGLGFKDIQLFNHALLAKQVWRLLQFPTCLLALFLKSRYFGCSSFLQAEMGDKHSFAWRNIIHGRALLKEGLQQMVGNGRSLRVWTSQ